MSNDLVADLLTRIRNSQRAGHRSVRVRTSKLVESILSVLKTEGFIESFDKKVALENENHTEFDVYLKYYETGEPVIGIANRVSKSGRRMYAGADDLPKVRSGLGISILSTSSGVMSDREARKKKVGGEVLAVIG